VSEPSRLPFVTISGSFGAGGSVIGPAVAEQLGVPFLDRIIPMEVARSLEVSVDEALDRDERRPPAVVRFITSLAAGGGALGASPTAASDAIATEHAFKSETERVIREFASQGGGVILGRAAAIVLGHQFPNALHVRVGGHRDERVGKVMVWQNLDRPAAERLVDRTDRAWESYARYFYKTDPRDPRLYHLVMDAVTLGPDLATELIVTAARARASGK
jgi:cytidylate kinase